VSTLLIVTAVEAERAAVLGSLPEGTPVRVVAGGVGPVAAALATSTALAPGGCRAVLCAGIAGGFTGVPVGSVVLAERVVAADLGAESADGFVSVEDLGFGPASYRTDPELLARAGDALDTAGVPARRGTVLTVSTTTGSASRAADLTARHPDALAEAMEGFGVAAAAAAHGVPMLELRAVSNLVGPRDRERWRIGDALAALGAAAGAVVSGLGRA
jgi:futalosine hydrolase